MRHNATARIQRNLNKHHGYKLKVDGIFGQKTSSAIRTIKRMLGMKDTDDVDPVTARAVKGEKIKSIAHQEPLWLQLARQEIGVKEWSGKRHNPRVLWYWAKAKLTFTSDETPWCAGFVCAMLEEAGLVSTQSGMAKSFMRWGKKIDRPILGAIAVFHRGDPKSASGHVGFVVGVDKNQNPLILGGNQSNAVNIKPMDRKRVAGYYWPRPVPVSDRIVLASSADRVSTNEA